MNLYPTDLSSYDTFLSCQSKEIEAVMKDEDVEEYKDSLKFLNPIITKMGFTAGVDPETFDDERDKLSEKIKELASNEEAQAKLVAYSQRVSRLANKYAKEITE